MARKKENKRSDGYYEYKCIVEKKFDGTPVYKSFYSKKSKADARLKAEEYKAELKEQDDRPDDILFEEWAEIFMAEQKNKVRANTFHNNYEITFNIHLIPYFKGRPLRTISKSDIENYVETKLNTLSKNTINQQLARLKMMFSDAIDNGYITVNPARSVSVNSGSAVKRVYTQDETDLILSYCPLDEFGLNVHMLLSYGMSRSEWLGIKFEDVNFQDLTLSINKGVTMCNGEITINEPKNKHRKRIIAISSESAEYIKEKISGGFLSTNSEEPVNISNFNFFYQNFMKRMQNYYLARDIFVPIYNIHELRHTRASLWVNEGRNLFAIAEMLGWSDLTMLRKVYGHADIQQLRKELDI